MFVFTTKCRLKSYQMLIKHGTVAWSWVAVGCSSTVTVKDRKAQKCSCCVVLSNCFIKEGLEVQLLCCSIKMLQRGRVRSAAVVLFYQTVTDRKGQKCSCCVVLSKCYRKEGLEVQLLCCSIKLLQTGRVRCAAVVLFYYTVRNRKGQNSSFCVVLSNCYREEGLEVQLFCCSIKMIQTGRVRSATVVLFYQNVIDRKGQKCR